MPDTPDYSKFQPGSVRFSLHDMGELAARLGSISVYDRRGEVLWFDTFSHGIGNYATVLSGTNASVKLSVSYSHRFPYSLLLRSGSNSGLTAGVEKFIGTFGSPRFGCEIGFAFGSNNNYLQLKLEANQSGSVHKAIIRLFSDTGILQILDVLGNYVQVGVCDFMISTPPTFIIMKLVADYENSMYMRLLVNDIEFDLTQYALRNDGDAPQGTLYFQVLNVGDNAFNSDMYMSYILITGNEP